MQVFTGIEEVPPGFGPSVATIGVFDGLHRGHQSLIRMVVEKARELDASPVVVTFDRHPLEVVAPGKEPPLITTLEQRTQVMASLGIEGVLVLRFDDALRRLSAEEFVAKILVGALRVAHVVTGSNFRFGYQHAGTIETLNDLAARHGFGLTAVALVADAEPISSSLIRRQIAAGEVETVAEELGRPFRLDGVVVRGAGRGKGLGIPTANLALDGRLILPKLGVYAGWLIHEGARLPAVINVGMNPTFEDRTRPVVEVHALDFEADLYGKVVGVEFTQRLRDELKFPGASELMAQIRKDIEQARAILGVPT